MVMMTMMRDITEWDPPPNGPIFPGQGTQQLGWKRSLQLVMVRKNGLRENKHEIERTNYPEFRTFPEKVQFSIYQHLDSKWYLTTYLFKSNIAKDAKALRL